MSTNNPAAAVAATNHDACAALSVWEEMLAIKAGDDREPDGLLRLWEPIGTSAMRSRALELGRFANAVWAALDDELRVGLEPLDWTFVPALLRTIEFDNDGLIFPSVNSAIAGLRARSAARTAREERAQITTSACAAPGGRLFLVAYEADGRPYALALSDLNVAHKLNVPRGGEVIDTIINSHADMVAVASKTYTVEVTWRVPEYVHLTVEAKSPDEAMAKALAEVSEHPDRFDRKLDYETCGPDKVTGLWEGDEAYPDGRPQSVPLPTTDEGKAVFVARYVNRHGGVEMRAFKANRLALAWRDEIARENWDSVRDGNPPDAIGDAYFKLQHDRGEESFSIEECRLRD